MDSTVLKFGVPSETYAPSRRDLCDCGNANVTATANATANVNAYANASIPANKPETANPTAPAYATVTG